MSTHMNIHHATALEVQPRGPLHVGDTTRKTETTDLVVRTTDGHEMIVTLFHEGALCNLAGLVTLDSNGPFQPRR